MSGLDNLTTRLNYYGGANQQKRMISDKLRSLKKALLYSYQSATIAVANDDGLFDDDSLQFRALINDDDLKEDYDDKILSVPYEDVCLNKGGIREINLSVGDVFKWVDTDTMWLVYLQYLEEYAYFRAQIRLCENVMELGDRSYWIYIRGPEETSIQWNQKSGVEWNDMNYSLVAYVTRNASTMEYFHRFKTVKITEPFEGGETKTWYVVAVNPYYGDGIIQVFLDEHFENAMQEASNPRVPDEESEDADTAHIEGPSYVEPYSEVSFSIVNFEDESGTWSAEMDGVEYAVRIEQENEKISSAWVNVPKTLKLELVAENSLVIKAKINVSKGKFTLFYTTNDMALSKEITIL